MSPNSEGEIECRSKNVVDAGYVVHVRYESRREFGSVYSQTFAGEEHEFFSGRLVLRRVSTKENCVFEMTDKGPTENPSLRITISKSGEGQIALLNSQPVPQDSFGELTCSTDLSIFRRLGCAP